MSPATEPSPAAAGLRQGRTTPIWRRGPRLDAPTHLLLLQAEGVWHAGHAGAPLQRSRWHESFETWCAAHPDTDCDLLASGTIVHDLVCEPNLPIRSDTQLIEHALAVFSHFHGEHAAGWRMACWFSGSTCGVSALHGIDFQALADVAGRHGVRIRHLRPWWSRVLAHVCRQLPSLHGAPTAWLMIVEGRFVNAVCLRHGRLFAIRPHWLEDAGPARLTRLGAQLDASAVHGAAPPVLLAAGHGLDDGPVTAIQVLGRLDETEPSAHWLLPPRGRT